MNHRAHFVITGLIAGCLAIAISPVVLAQTKSPSEIDFYMGNSLSQSGITLSSWGSGQAGSVSNYAYTSSNSIKVISQGLYQGADLTFIKPVDISSVVNDPDAYFQMYVLPPSASKSRNKGYYSPFGGSGPMSGMPNSGGGRAGGGEYGGGGPYGGEGGPYGGGRMGGGPNNPYGNNGGYNNNNQETLKPAPNMKSVRMVLVMDDGKMTECTMSLVNAGSSHDSWEELAIPLKDIPGLATMSDNIKQIQIFCDTSATFYIGEIRIMHDDTPITIDQQSDQTIAVNDIVTFTGSAEAGPTLLRYEWNFGTNAGPVEKNGEFMVDAEGKTVQKQFTKSGDYVVTLRVSDIYGIKPPAYEKINIHVTL